MTTVLLVDDNEAALYAHDRVLRQAGFDVLQAQTRKGALDLSRSGIDAILLEIRLPDTSGLDVCSLLKRDPATASIPVLHLTATYGAGVEAAALEGGADAYLTLPVEPIVLVATVRALLRAREAETIARRVTAWWQSTFDAISEGVALLDRDARILRCNRAMADLLGSRPEDLIGTLAVVALPGADEPAQGWPVRRALTERRRAASEVARGDRCYDVVADPVLDEQGEVTAIVRTVKDVTGRKEAEARLGELLLAEQAARQEAEQVNRVKDEFLATVSHELRTPLNAIVGWVHLLKSEGLDAARTAQAVETIARNAHVQSQLISDMLDVSRIVAGKLRLEPRLLDLTGTVREAQETVRPAAEAKGIRIESALDPGAGPFIGDPDRLQQVAWNLLANAIKFTPRGGQVHVRLELAGTSVLLTVEDNGPGIDAAFLPYVFDRFRQADASTTRPHGGLGLGLAIVRHLVELHGGTVSARNNIGKPGAIFQVALPRPVADPARSPGGGPRPESTWVPAGPSLVGTKVLLVDDDEDVRSLVAFVLERGGATVLTASSVPEALQAVITHRPDVLLADVEMPGEDGYSLIAKVRALPPDGGGAIPAAAITGYAGAQDRMRALQAGFQIHLPKPVQPAEIVTVVAALKKTVLRP